MNLRPGRLMAIVIVGGWVTLLTLHLWPSDTPPTAAADIDLKAPVGANLTQRGVFYRGSKIGFIREKLTPLEDGHLAEQKGRFTLNVMGKERNLEIEGSAKLAVGGVLNEFSYRLTTASGRSPFETRVKGIVEGSELALTINSGDSERTQRRALDRPIVLPLNIYYSVAAQGLEAGKHYRLQLFDPMTLTEGEVEITVMEPEIVHWGGHEEQAYRLRSQFSGLTTTAWINEEGQILKEETPLGWTLLKEEPGSGLHARSASNVPEIVAASAIPAIGYVEHPEELTRVRLKLHKFPEFKEGLTGGRQTVEDNNELIIEVESLPPSTTNELTDVERRRYLSSDAFIQADDVNIQELAQQLARGHFHLDAARAISDWVHSNVRKTPTLSIPSAAEVLEQRAGDCNEHTVLFTALARAAGIPTRICTGLAWSTGRFYYHAWPEVWVGMWLAVDPTFGQFPADPLHIRLLAGGLEQQFEVLSLMGRGATIEIMEAK